MIRDLAALLVETGLSEIEIEKSGLKIRVARNLSVSAVAPQQAAPASPVSPAGQAGPAEPASDIANHPGCVKSPMVGTAYRAPEPGAAPFVEIGSRVVQGQT